MKMTALGWKRPWWHGETVGWPCTRLARRNALHLVSAPELENLREALSEGRVPLDLQAKLDTLARQGLLHHFIEQNSMLFISLLLAAQAGEFHGATPADRERLLRVLAYVRKDDDAIPDQRPGGFVDDHREVRAASLELEPLLDQFKFWHLRHQVPRMWLAKREPRRTALPSGSPA